MKTRARPKTEAVAGFGSLLRAVLLTAAAVPVGVATLFVGYFTHWILALPVAACALVLLVKARPRLIQEWRAMDRRSQHPVAVRETSDDRRRCPCCGAPTFSAERDTCLVCEWADGLELASGEPLRLEEAVHNFRRYGSVYPPDMRPGWSTSAPAARELAVRRELLRAYARIDAGKKNGWFRALRLERQLEDLEYRRIAPD